MMLLSYLALALTVGVLLPEVSSDEIDNSQISDSEKEEIDKELVKSSEQTKDLERKALASGNTREANHMRYERRKILSKRKRVTKEKISKVDYTEFKSAANAFDSVFALLTSDNPQDREQAVLSFLSSLAEIVPGQIGELLGTLVSFLSGIFDSKSPSQMEQFEKIIKTEFQLHQFRSMKGELESELRKLDNFKVALSARTNYINDLVDACVWELLEADDSITEDDADAQCFDEIRLSKLQVDEFIQEVGNFHLSPTGALGKIKSFVLQDSNKLKDAEQMERIYNMLLMYLKLQSRYILCLEEYSDFIGEQRPESLLDNSARGLVQSERDYFANFENAIADPESPSVGIFALYIMYMNETNPVLDSLARKLAKQIEHQVQRPETRLGWRLPTGDSGGRAENVITIVLRTDMLTWALTKGHNINQFMLDGPGGSKRPVGCNFKLSWINQDSPALGVRMQVTNGPNKGKYLGKDYRGWFLFVEDPKEAAAVTFIPVTREGARAEDYNDVEKPWMMATDAYESFALVLGFWGSTYYMAAWDMHNYDIWESTPGQFATLE